MAENRDKTLMKRRKTKTVKLGSVKIGQRHPVSIQSMVKTNTEDVSATVKQIKALEAAGCEIVRLAVKNINQASVLDRIKRKITIPLVADIHFNYQLALKAIERGVDGLRLNPGNVYRRDEVKQIARAAKKRKVPIRVGVNSGSVQRTRDEGRGTKDEGRKKKDIAGLMVKTALDYVKLLESFDFYDIIISLKASSVAETVSAYRKMAKFCHYPFHLGVTATGLAESGIVKSAIGIGSLLLEGIGDTIRVSLTGSPREEITVAREILQSLGLRYFGPEIIACPTCGRCQVDVIKIAQEISKKLHVARRTSHVARPLKVAIMGCEVNGPGEARDADVGIAGGKNCAVLFKKGKVVKRIKEDQIVDALVKEFER